MNKYDILTDSMNTLVYYRSILKNEVAASLIKLLRAHNKNHSKRAERYTKFISLLFRYTVDFTSLVKDLLIDIPNTYIKKYAAGSYITDTEEKAVYRDIEILQQLCEINAAELKKDYLLDSKLPEWKNTKIDLAVEFKNYLSNIEKTGFGIFAKYNVFKMTAKLTPIVAPDKIQLEDLTGYERQREKLILNTRALLEGKQASNVLLYGDSGTGKSSSIKAIANKYFEQGLRLIEIGQTKLHKLPDLIEILNQEPLKFIIFIDDLSFAEENKDFSALKAILEGSAVVSGNNCVIYATSNRRHLIKENFSDRGDNDIHVNETIQQLTALSDRFGLKINFGVPSKETYLKTVDNLLKEHDLPADISEVHREAEAFAIIQGNRSPRTACQFIRQLINHII